MPSLEKTIIQEGNRTDYPKKGDTVTMNYTGWLYDETCVDKRGREFDSSSGRGEFKTPIGVGRVIPGWDQKVLTMSLGERSVLTIPENLAYGKNGFPGFVPSHTDLIFEVELLAINDKRT